MQKMEKWDHMLDTFLKSDFISRTHAFNYASSISLQIVAF